MNINVMKKRYTIEVPGGADKVLLHTCCAPCSSAIIECLMSHGITPVIYYCNPNIYPEEEYRIRKYNEAVKSDMSQLAKQIVEVMGIIPCSQDYA